MIRFNSNQAFCLVIADVNELKLTNTDKGYRAGDNLIVTASRNFVNCLNVPTEDTIFRIGGDEFAALIDCDEAMHSTELNCSHSEFTVATKFSEDFTTQEDLFEATDQLLRRRKTEFYHRTGKERRKH